MVTWYPSTEEQWHVASTDTNAPRRCQVRPDASVAPKGGWSVNIVQRTPTAVAVLRTAFTLHTCGDDSQHADPFDADACRFARAAEMLDAPASVELQAPNALEESLGADDA